MGVGETHFFARDIRLAPTPTLPSSGGAKPQGATGEGEVSASVLSQQQTSVLSQQQTSASAFITQHQHSSHRPVLAKPLIGISWPMLTALLNRAPPRQGGSGPTSKAQLQLL